MRKITPIATNKVKRLLSLPKKKPKVKKRKEKEHPHAIPLHHPITIVFFSVIPVSDSNCVACMTRQNMPKKKGKKTQKNS